MEYRMKYRDIPWIVAICVLPGKIIGTFIIKPVNEFRYNWKRTLIRCAEILMIALVIAFVMALLFMLIESLTENSFSAWLTAVWAL